MADSKQKKSSRSDYIIGGKFKIQNKIGQGSFGDIYLGKNILNEDQVAIKIEKRHKNNVQLRNEKIMYNILAENVGIPRMHYFGYYKKCHVLVMERLGPNLEELFNFCERRFSLKTVLQLFDQFLERIECVHSKGIIHRDIKPHNFLTGIGATRNTVYLTDFGLSKFYLDPASNKHIDFCDYKKLVGTARYSSINTHLGYQQSRRDDLEAIGYIMIYFIAGKLPWQGIAAITKKQTYERIAQVKISTTPEILCKDLPIEFVMYLKYCRKLLYDEDPNYAQMRQMFKNLFYECEYQFDNNYDWNMLEQRETKKSVNEEVELNKKSL